ncbi:BREX system P-loop protein BrxC [Pseudopelagicola sp. nBUS_20]|uniref:BREX system P-loop protein BrxC n=1 Tax=Pseudopelagicola sp. nBUS_20 TaxID=3395317 RepID=UPI003EB88B67
MTTLMRDIFLKPVDRPIDGVIKADDEASLRVELDEYVITTEIGTRLERFLNAYNNYQTANGVWISGFFGSGKSHLLKMLALLLENEPVDGKHPLTIFEEKLVGEPMLAGDLRKAVAIPSKSILFNIDQKADVISKSDIDALLSVFQKVFDEACGYFGKQPYIAQFERDLDERGQLDAFKTAYEAEAKTPWERGREQAALEGRNIAAAFASVTGSNAEDAKDILKNYRTDTRVSIEDFANKVKEWIDRQGPKFRLNFFVDEVGQYIADNVKLMTNLQTIAESLNTKCKGQAWVIVTSQQDMEAIIGDNQTFQSQDFSKIMARFNIRMPLNSADVAEVIQRRLLAKTDAGAITLGNLHDREENNLKTLFDFTDGSIKLKNFHDKEHFIASYPFPGYQYDLFQMAIRGLSQHNAFEGKHSSVGERSMLGVFQEVSKTLIDQPVRGLATFDMMFEGIRTALTSAAQSSILIAESNLGDPFSVRVLKALFLVKYIKEFKPTVRNISILMLSDFNADQTVLRRDIEAALSELERNTYIQRNGEVYEFLTNEEKDVEDEIKSVDIDPAELSSELEALVFDSTLRHRKIKHGATGHEYAFSRMLDGHVLGRTYELAINVISPFNDDVDSPEAIRMRSMGSDELVIHMPSDVRFIRDLTLFKQTDKFVRQARTGSPQPGRDRIVAEKGDQNRRRRKDIEMRLAKLMSEARMFVRGDELEIRGEDPQERITKAFQTLVDKIYVNLGMLRGVVYSEVDLKKAARSENSLFGQEGSGLGEAEQEILNFVQSQARNGVKVSAKYLKDRFSAKPYGWPEIAVFCVAASLVGKGKVEVRSDGAVKEGDALVSGLQNNRLIENLLFTPQTEFTSAQLRKAKDLYKELFDAPADGSDARSLGAEWSGSVVAMVDEIKNLTQLEAKYPFTKSLKPLQAKLQAMADKPAGWFITEVVAQEDDLLNDKEDLLDKIRSFMGGSQRAIFDDVQQFLASQLSNIEYVDAEAARQLRDVIEDPSCFKGSMVQNLKAEFYALKDKVELQLLNERKAVQTAVADIEAKVLGLSEYADLLDEAKSQVSDAISSRKTGLDNINLIPALRDRKNSIQNDLFTDMLMLIERLKPAPVETKPQAKPDARDETPPDVSPPATPPKEAPPKIVKASQVHVDFKEPYLADEADVDRYVEELKKSLIAEIRDGNKVVV